MKKSTKKLENKLVSIQTSYLKLLDDSKKLVSELLWRNGDKIRIPDNMLNGEMCINVYGKYNSEEYFFAGAMIKDGEIYLLCVAQDSYKEEIVTPGYYDRTDLIDVANNLILYLNDELEVNEEYEEE